MPYRIPTGVSTPILDEQATLHRLRGNTRFLSELYAVFLDDLPPKLTALSSALSQDDETALRRIAHSIKGAAATISALSLRQQAERLEHAARQGRSAEVRDVAQRIIFHGQTTLEHVAASMQLR
ncbi:Hpt domain-containing protein [Desulfobaculum senezii]|jgi:HPt (histidine-containing phosphotransfer) domain-containing protein